MIKEKDANDLISSLEKEFPQIEFYKRKKIGINIGLPKGMVYISAHKGNDKFVSLFYSSAVDLNVFKDSLRN